jgi:hypothetical protein
MQRSIRVLVATGLLVSVAHAGLAQSWSGQLFEKTSHDFGTVARAAKTEHIFEFTNRLNQDIHIRGVRVSCGCTTPKVETYTVKSGEKGAVRAILNTRSYTGARTAIITVVFDRPSYSEVQLSVKGYVRRDVVLNPGGADFGSVCQGQGAERKIDLQYAGRNDWKITAIRSPDANVTVRAQETRRDYGRVGYELLVRLSADAPPGFINTEMTLETNDWRSKTVPLPVTGHVSPALTVSPALLFLGSVKSGEVLEKRLVVRGTEAFRVLRVECDDPRFTFEVSDEAKELHFVPVNFKAGPETGKIAQQIRIHTDLLGGQVADVAASGTIVP